MTGMLNAPPSGPLPLPATPTNFRKSVTKLSDAELADLRRAFTAVKELEDERGFWYFAGWHGIPFNWCEHHTPLFLPWHRQYLYYFELALQSQVPGVTLPWWDWTTSGSIPAAFSEPNDTPLLPGAYHVYRSSDIQQAPDRAPGQDPTVPAPPHTDDWNEALDQPTFLTFQNKIEQIHDDMHVWTGGIMVDIELAAYDPLFFAHHTMVDRAWRIWQHRHPGALPPASLLDVGLRPNGMTVRQTLEVTALGYEYASSQDTVDGTHPGGAQ